MLLMNFCLNAFTYYPWTKKIKIMVTKEIGYKKKNKIKLYLVVMCKT